MSYQLIHFIRTVPFPDLAALFRRAADRALAYRRLRRDYDYMLSLPDALLDDVGLSRHDFERARRNMLP